MLFRGLYLLIWGFIACRGGGICLGLPGFPPAWATWISEWNRTVYDVILYFIFYIVYIVIFYIFLLF